MVQLTAIIVREITQKHRKHRNTNIKTTALLTRKFLNILIIIHSCY